MNYPSCGFPQTSLAPSLVRLNTRFSIWFSNTLSLSHKKVTFCFIFLQQMNDIITPTGRDRLFVRRT